MHPAEWQPHDATWLVWPTHTSEWPHGLAPVQQTIATVCETIAQYETVHVLVASQDAGDDVNRRVSRPVQCHVVDTDDLWLRDSGPVFANTADGVVAHTFSFNGWGGRFACTRDRLVGARIAELAGAPVRAHDLVLEGGALEHDGRGAIITTAQCVLNANRNPGVDRRTVERVLADAFEANAIVWLERGLRNDHTDGHVDNLARFVGPDLVACAEPLAGDPNADVHREVADRLASESERLGLGLDIVTLPSPGAIIGAGGELLAASYLNFYICNAAVLVPVFGVTADDTALAALADLFGTRAIVPIDARPLLAGGGAIHCATQEQPSGATS